MIFISLLLLHLLLYLKCWVYNLPHLVYITQAREWVTLNISRLCGTQDRKDMYI